MGRLEKESWRLKKSSEIASLEPDIEINWDDVRPDLFGMTPEWSTKYGLPEWHNLRKQEQVLLTKHEVSSIMGTGIWFEMILMQMVLRDMYNKPVQSEEFQYALTEIGDECRHSVMFANVAKSYGCPSYGPKKSVKLLGWFFKTLAKGPSAYGSILIAEEILDVMQRDWLSDDRVQPITRASSAIHVIEESRHMRFAREQVRDQLKDMPKWKRDLHAIVIAGGAYFIVTNMVSKDVVGSVGISPRVSPEYKHMLRMSSGNLMRFLSENGLRNRVADRIYAKIGL